MEQVDVIVVGAGPGGTTAARRLVDAGVDVLVLDRAAGPGFKIGESLLPEGVLLCREIGLGPALEQAGFQRKHGVRFILAEDGASRRFDFGHALRAERQASAYEVPRRAFDELLVRHAQQGGARVEWNANVTDLDLGSEQDDADEHVTLQLADGRELRARMLVDASGSAGLLARTLGVREPLPRLRKAALFTHVTGVPRAPGDEAGDISIIWWEDGWFWVIPFADGSASVGIVAEPEILRAAGPDDQTRFDTLCNAHATTRDLLGQRTLLRDVEMLADYSWRNATPTHPRAVSVGDAAGFLDPVFSTGVFVAQLGGLHAADMIAGAFTQDRLPTHAERQAYETLLGTASDRLLTFVRQFYDDRLAVTFVRSKHRETIYRAITSLLAGDVLDEDNPLIRLGMLNILAPLGHLPQ